MLSTEDSRIRLGSSCLISSDWYSDWPCYLFLLTLFCLVIRSIAEIEGLLDITIFLVMTGSWFSSSWSGMRLPFSASTGCLSSLPFICSLTTWLFTNLRLLRALFMIEECVLSSCDCYSSRISSILFIRRPSIMRSRSFHLSYLAIMPFLSPGFVRKLYRTNSDCKPLFNSMKMKSLSCGGMLSTCYLNCSFKSYLKYISLTSLEFERSFSFCDVRL